MNYLTYFLIVAIVTIGSCFLTGWLMVRHDERQEAKELGRKLLGERTSAPFVCVETKI
ncbi:MAG: hypothetical protein ABSF36_03600 [Candidatus Methanomethylicaceae archaeon]